MGKRVFSTNGVGKTGSIYKYTHTKKCPLHRYQALLQTNFHTSMVHVQMYKEVVMKSHGVPGT